MIVRKGASFVLTLRPATSEQRYVPISSITMGEAGTRLVATGHGLKAGWHFRVSRCEGLTRLNTVDEISPQPSDWFQATVIDVDTVDINSVNTTGDAPYDGGGVLQYGIPMDLTGCSVRAQIRKTERSAEILLDLAAYIDIDAVDCKVNFDVPGSETTLLPGSSGVLGIEIDDSALPPRTFTLPPLGLEFKAEIVHG